MIRSAIGALAACAMTSAAFTSTAQAQIVVPPPCTAIFNGDFSSGSAFWFVDIETGEFGDTGTGVFTSFAPLSLVPPGNANVATFFTEALAEGDHEFHLGSAANSTVFFGRRLLSAPSGSLQFQFGGQLSFILIGDGTYQYSLQLIVRNETTGDEAKCKLAAGKLSTNMNPGTEGVVTIPFQNFDICDCEKLFALATAGDTIEILLVPSVRADARQPGSSAFIGGPFFFDNFQFCLVPCPVPGPVPGPIPGPGPVPGPVPQAQAEPIVEQRPITEDLSHLTHDELRLRALDTNGDGVVDEADMTPILDLTGPNADVNRDGAVTLDDAFIVLDIIDGHAHPTFNADANRDGEINELDIKLIMETGDLR
jgi:hypothetical protein